MFVISATVVHDGRKSAIVGLCFRTCGKLLLLDRPRSGQPSVPLRNWLDLLRNDPNLSGGPVGMPGGRVTAVC